MNRIVDCQYIKPFGLDLKKLVSSFLSTTGWQFRLSLSRNGMIHSDGRISSCCVPSGGDSVGLCLHLTRLEKHTTSTRTPLLAKLVYNYAN